MGIWNLDLRCLWGRPVSLSVVTVLKNSLLFPQVHYGQIKQDTKDGFRSLEQGSMVEYDLKEDPKNPEKCIAVNVTGQDGVDCVPKTRREWTAPEGAAATAAPKGKGKKGKGKGKKGKGKGKKGKGKGKKEAVATEENAEEAAEAATEENAEAEA